MKTTRNSRSKRSTFMIDLVQTINGYSLIEGTQLLNKPKIIPQLPKQIIQSNIPPSIINNNIQQPNSVNISQLTNIPLQRQNRYYGKRINLIAIKGGQFLSQILKQMQQLQVKQIGCCQNSQIKDSINEESNQNKQQQNLFKRKHPEQIQRRLTINDKNVQLLTPHKQLTSNQSRKFADWFNMNNVHEKQQNMIITWMKESNISSASSRNNNSNIKQTQQFKNLVIEYKRHRNQIVKLYLEEYAPKKKYLTAIQIRKYICTDACWLMRLHVFLSSWGIINSHHINFEHQSNEQEFLFKQDPQTKLLKMLPYDLSLQPNLHEQTKEQNQNKLLKKLTFKMRPYCDFCGIHCGIVWFQHLRIIDPKQIAQIMKNVNSRNPMLSDKQYQIILCTKCYCDGNFPLLLTHQDFKKISVNDKMQPDRKKKKKDKKSKQQRKRQKKQRKRARKQKKRRMKQQQRLGEPFDQQKYQAEQIAVKQKEQQFFRQPDLNVNSIIEKILSSQQADKKWKSQQVLRLLQLIELHGEDWQLIHQKLQKQGKCTDKTPQQIIGYFVSLPKRGVSKINEQYSKEEFLKDNHRSNSTNMIDLVCQRALIKASKASSKKNSENDIKRIGQSIKAQQNSLQSWKKSINDFVMVYMKDKMDTINRIQEIEKISKQNLKHTRQIFKRVSIKDI